MNAVRMIQSRFRNRNIASAFHAVAEVFAEHRFLLFTPSQKKRKANTVATYIPAASSNVVIITPRREKKLRTLAIEALASSSWPFLSCPPRAIVQRMEADMPHVGPVSEGRTFFCPHCGA